MTDFEALAQLHDISGVAVPPAVDGLETAPVRHKTTVAAADMQAAVETYLRTLRQEGVNSVGKPTEFLSSGGRIV